MKRTKINDPGEEDFVIHSDPGDEDELPTSSLEQAVEPLTPDEITNIRWLVFGKCPICGNYVKDWQPGAFNPERYKYWQDNGVDALTGHKTTCSEKWRRA